MKKKFLLAAVGALLLCSGAGEAAVPLSLSESVGMALARDKSIEAAEAGKGTAKWQLSAADLTLENTKQTVKYQTTEAFSPGAERRLGGGPCPVLERFRQSGDRSQCQRGEIHGGKGRGGGGAFAAERPCADGKRLYPDESGGRKYPGRRRSGETGGGAAHDCRGPL